MNMNVSLRRVLCIAVIAGSAAPAAAQPIDDAPRRDGAQLATQVLGIFADRCAKCHDPAQGKIEGEFGHVLDLARLAAEADVVVPGKPDESLLFELVQTGEMPSKGDGLTTEQVTTIRLWIEAGAPTPPAQDVDEVKDAIVTRNRLVVWLGQFHPSVVHFPIALLVAAALAEVLRSMTRRDRYADTARFCTGLATLSGIVAALLGWANAGMWGQDDWPTTIHRITGSAVAVWGVIVWIMGQRARWGTVPKRRRAYRIALVLGAALVLVTGFFGGAIVHGLGHLRW